jgi:IS30 family transposase
MSKNYTQLCLEQRYQMEALLEAGLKQNAIAKQLGFSPSSISRELKRNVAKRGRTAGVYKASNAHRRTMDRHHNKPKKIVFNEGMKQEVVKHLEADRWSPELINATCKTSSTGMVSHERIYQWIWDCKHTNKRENKLFKKLHTLLKHGKRRRKRGNRKDSRGIILNRVSIEKRPKIVQKRKRLGDIEIDLMMGKDHKGALLVMTDRASLHTRIKKVASKNSSLISKAIINALKRSKYPMNTLTFDNDKAFSNHVEIGKRVNAATYFTRPYTSQDKGTVENRIGVIRRFFPKKTDLRFVSDKEVKQVEKKINNRPIRKFKYLNANQVLLKKIALIT